MAEDISMQEILTELNRQSRELKSIRELLATSVSYIVNAESEIPERMRRFTNYAHDLHCMKYMYEELGVACPPHLCRELERVDDRYRQIVKELHLDGGVFEKVRRDMAADPENRYDHTRLLYKPKEVDNEAGKSNGEHPIGP